MKAIILFTTLVGITFLNINVLAQHGIAPQWTPEVQLPTPPSSNSIRGFLYSNIGVFSNGKRVVFLNRQDGSGGMYHTHSYDGVTWSTPVLFASDSLVVGLNSLKAISDHNDEMHVIWASQMPKALYYSKMDSALNLVLDSVKISDNPEFNSFSDMYLTNDLKGRIHVIWNEGKTGTDLPESFYAQSSDGGVTWSLKDTLSNHDGIPSSFPRGQFNAYSGDTLAIFWRDSSTIGIDNWDIQMVVSQDGGLNWGAPQLINSNMNMQGDPDLVIDPQGRFHLFYHEAAVFDPYWGMRLLYGYSDDLGATWQPSSTFQDTISLAQRSYLAEGSRYDVQNNVLWTFWKEEDMLGLQGGDMMASYSTDRGVNWSIPEYVTDRNDTTIGFKSVALLPDGGLAINYELANYPDSGLFSIFYSERTPLSLSINDGPNDRNMLIYPNPTSGIVKIHYEDLEVYEIEVFNLHGQLMFHKQLSSNQPFFNLDIDTYLNGIYLIKLRTTDSVLTKKIIKQ